MNVTLGISIANIFNIAKQHSTVILQVRKGKWAQFEKRSWVKLTYTMIPKGICRVKEVECIIYYLYNVQLILIEICFIRSSSQGSQFCEYKLHCRVLQCLKKKSKSSLGSVTAKL